MNFFLSKGLVAESAAKQQAEERKEKAELWADTKAERLGKLTILWIKATGFREKKLFRSFHN